MLYMDRVIHHKYENWKPLSSKEQDEWGGYDGGVFVNAVMCRGSVSAGRMLLGNYRDTTSEYLMDYLIHYT